jgi:hypothetical protein
MPFDIIKSIFFVEVSMKTNGSLPLRDCLLPMLMSGQVKVGDEIDEMAMAAEPRGV